VAREDRDRDPGVEPSTPAIPMRLRSFSHWSRGPRARQFMARFGADFNLLVPGALHRANGGYLILDAQMENGRAPGQLTIVTATLAISRRRRRMWQ
jgi:hypothetical protein